MNLLLDTHVLLWAAGASGRLPDEGRALLEQQETQPVFSAASIWVGCDQERNGGADFHVDPHLLRRGLLEHGYTELAVTGAPCGSRGSVAATAQGYFWPHPDRAGPGRRGHIVDNRQNRGTVPWPDSGTLTESGGRQPPTGPIVILRDGKDAREP